MKSRKDDLSLGRLFAGLISREKTLEESVLCMCKGRQGRAVVVGFLLLQGTCLVPPGEGKGWSRDRSR